MKIDGLTDEQVARAMAVVQRQPDADELLMPMIFPSDNETPNTDETGEEVLPGFDWNDDEVAKMVAMRLSGCTYREIATEFRCEQQEVKKQIDEWVRKWTSQ